MILRRLCILASTLTILCLSGSASAQDSPEFETGLKPFGTYHGGNIDSVSVTNGNLTWSAPPFWSSHNVTTGSLSPVLAPTGSGCASVAGGSDRSAAA